MDFKNAITQKLFDDREPDIIRTKMLELGWQQKRLYSTDYLFHTHNMKKVGIERKTVSDLLGSLNDRLSRQLADMLEYCDYSILLLEGKWQMVQNQMYTSRGIEYYTWTMIWNYLRSWQDKGITLELTHDEGHTIKRINELYAYYQKPVHTGGVNKKSFVDSRILALQCGGIGNKLGQLLLDKFGNIRNIANATAQDYLTVDGIGKAKAEALYAHFNKS
jgi:ERCC4-type nuclease